jgi:glycosyltransferase involved in cell wall biosynthesis
MRSPDGGIGLLVGQLSHGGAERQTALLLEQLATRHGLRPWVYCMSEKLDPFAESLRKTGNSVTPWKRKGSFEIRRCLSIRREVRKRGGRLLHAINYEASAYGYFALVGLRGVRLLPSIRNSAVRPGLPKRLLFGRILRSCPRVIVNSHAGRSFLERSFRIPTERIIVIPNGIDLARCEGARPAAKVREILGIPPEAPVIGFVGRAASVKNIPAMFEIVRRVFSSKADSVLLLVGEGLPEESRRSPIAAEGGRILALGPRDDVYDLMGAMDVLLLTSRAEGCPNVLLEAMALGVAVVATRVGDCPRIIRHGVDGFLYDSGREADAAALVLELLNHPDRRRAIGEQARQTIRTAYRPEIMADRTVEVYRELLAACGQDSSGS